MYAIEDYKEEEHVTYTNSTITTVRYHQRAIDPIPRWATNVEFGDGANRNAWQQRVHPTDKFVDMSVQPTPTTLKRMSDLRYNYDLSIDEAGGYLDSLLDLIPGV